MPLDADHAMSQMDVPAACNDIARDRLPHLAGTELGVEEALDQAGLSFLLSGISPMSETAPLRACASALVTDNPLIRCAPQAAVISAQGTPHTFSV